MAAAKVQILSAQSRHELDLLVATYERIGWRRDGEFRVRVIGDPQCPAY